MTASLGPLQKSLVEAGLAKPPKQRKPRTKQFKCHRCKAPMVKIEDSNIMVCSNEKCNNYFIFDKVV